MVLPFEKEYRERFYQLLNNVFESNFWSDGGMTRAFEEKFEEFTGLPSCAVTNGGTALLSILEYVDVRDKEVIVPANTFWATAQAAKKAGAKVVYADCNKEDLCMNFDDMASKVTDNTKAVIVVHIGGHIAFEIERITAYCEAHNITLIEDCAHAHGAEWNGRAAGSYGLAGSYSFYATKTMPLGEGGMIVSRDQDLIAWMKKFRNYGKEVIDGAVTYPIKEGFNYRMNEFTAALGIVQLERLPAILAWKRSLAQKFDQIFSQHVIMPEGMKSGYYKYIVFNQPKLRDETGKVFNCTDFGNEIEGVPIELPNSYWVAGHHRCAPIYYGWEKAGLSVQELKDYLLG